MPKVQGYGYGDLFIHINVWTPNPHKLSKEQKEFFESMLDNEHFSPKPSKNDKTFFEKIKDMFM